MRTPRFRIGALFSLPVLVFAVAGCGSADGIAHHSVSGAITLDGQPLAAATIVFVPDSPGAKAVASGLVQDGRFSIPWASGPAPGVYRVRISRVATNQPNPDTSPEAPPRITRETLPAKYNSDTILTAEIRADQPNELHFKLDSN